MAADPVEYSSPVPASAQDAVLVLYDVLYTIAVNTSTDPVEYSGACSCSI